MGFDLYTHGKDLDISNVRMVEFLISWVYLWLVMGKSDFNRVCQLGSGPPDLTGIPMVFDPT